MQFGNKRTIAVVLFTLLIILLVNFAWWLFYWETEESFEIQLSRRLSSLASLGATYLSPDLIGNLNGGYLTAYDSCLNIIENIKSADDLSEVFIIDADFNYLATTFYEADSTYFLFALNEVYIDSALNQLGELSPVVTPGYEVDNIVLKSAFYQLADTTGFPVAVLGIEANVDYTGVLIDLRNNLYLSTFVSVLAGLIFGAIFFVFQRRMIRTEKSLLMVQSQANLGRMVAVVSHEIKNPLMIIRASAERIFKKEPEYKEAGFIIEETDRLNKLLTNYLDIASGRMKLNIEKVDLNKLIESIGEKFIPQLANDKINLTYWHIDKGLYARADGDSLRQVIINLVLNGASAVKDISEPKIEMVARKVNGRAVVEVIDNGPGISSKDAGSIFEPFYTTKTTGSGLGLYHSRKLIENMNGKIEYNRTEDNRTSFKVELDSAE